VCGGAGAAGPTSGPAGAVGPAEGSPATVWVPPVRQWAPVLARCCDRLPRQRTAARRRALVALCIGLLGQADALAAGDTPRLDERLRARLATAAPDEPLPVQIVLREDALPPPGPARRAHVRQRQDRALARLPGRSFEMRRRYESLRGMALWARPGAIEALERDPDVERVYLDIPVSAAMVQGTVLIGSDQVVDLGFTGAGVTVAVLDTGIDTDHTYLSDALVVEQCYCDDSPAPGNGCCPGGDEVESGPGSAEDDEGHGTGMAGVITSSRVTNPGVAPDAEIAAVKVLPATGEGSSADIVSGLEWVLANHETWGIRVVNMSLSDAGEYDDDAAFPCTGSMMQIAISDLVAAGVTVFVASGNNGYDDGISFPACVPDAISVGGFYDVYINNGATWCLNEPCSQTCTDTPAFASGFVCHTNAGSLLDILTPDYITRTLAIGGGQVNLGGTSVSSAYASGEAALLLSLDPSLGAADLRSLLSSNAAGFATNPDSGLSYPRTDLFAAYVEVLASFDGDSDGVLDDGDGSGVIGDAPCAGGQAAGCDDNCPALPNPGQGDVDGDAVGNGCDNCPYLANPGQQDGDEDGTGDVCENPLVPAAAPALGVAQTLLLAAVLVAAGVARLRRGARRPSTRHRSASC